MAQAIESKPASNVEEILTYSEIARRIGKSRQTVKNWADSGLIPIVRLPSRLPGVRLRDVESLLSFSESLR